MTSPSIQFGTIWTRLWPLCARKPPKKSSADCQCWAHPPTIQRRAYTRRRFLTWSLWGTLLVKPTKRIRIRWLWSPSSRRSHMALEQRTVTPRRLKLQQLPERKASFKLLTNFNSFIRIYLTSLFPCYDRHLNLSINIMTWSIYSRVKWVYFIRFTRFLFSKRRFIFSNKKSENFSSDDFRY